MRSARNGSGHILREPSVGHDPPSAWTDMRSHERRHSLVHAFTGSVQKMESPCPIPSGKLKYFVY
jgi:hypothetical protein